LIAGATGASQEEIYRFVDSRGVLIISSTPPSKRVKAKSVTPVPAPSSGHDMSVGTYDNILKHVRTYSKMHRVDSRLVQAMIKVESNFDPLAISPAGAQGLMQLIPATARRFGVTDAFDMEENIRGGVQYMAWLLDKFNHDVRLAVAGYNAGEGAVDRHRGIPPYKETRNYVKSVLSNYRCLCANPASPVRAAAQQVDKSVRASRDSSLTVQRKGRGLLITNYR
jgi:hypothetical protein